MFKTAFSDQVPESRIVNVGSDMIDHVETERSTGVKHELKQLPAIQPVLKDEAALSESPD